MSSPKNNLLSLFLISLTLPAAFTTKPPNLRCYYSTYNINVTDSMFNVVVTECPRNQVCYKADGLGTNQSTLTHRGCMLLENCEGEKMIRIHGLMYNTSYSCCDSSYCNTGTGIAANFFTLLIIIGSLFVVMGV